MVNKIFLKVESNKFNHIISLKDIIFVKTILKSCLFEISKNNWDDNISRKKVKENKEKYDLSIGGIA